MCDSFLFALVLSSGRRGTICEMFSGGKDENMELIRHRISLDFLKTETV